MKLTSGRLLAWLALSPAVLLTTASLGQAQNSPPTVLRLYSPTASSNAPPTAEDAPKSGSSKEAPVSSEVAAPASESEAPATPAFGGPLWERTKLTGDWMCIRNDLAARGITFDISATEYIQGIASGGLKETSKFGGHNDYYMSVDGQKAGLWQGLLIDLHAESIYGKSVNPDTGALIPVNMSLEFPSPNGSVTALTGVKITQALSEHFAVFGGKINTFDGFAQPFLPGKGIDNGFMNLAAAVNPILGRTVPYSTLGGGASILVDGQAAATVMVLDTHDTPTTSGFPEFLDNGVTILAMSGLPSNFFDMPGHHIFLGTYSTGKYAQTDNDVYTLIKRITVGLPPLARKSGSWSLTYLFDQTLWTDPCNPKRSWGLYGNLGVSDSNPNPISWSGCIGVAGSSPISSRKLDTFGIAYYYVALDDGFRNIAPRLVPLRDEQGVELFYNVGVTPWLHITPDVQVINPVRERADTSFVLGLRAKFDF